MSGLDITGKDVTADFLVTHPGGLGDLVLVSELIASLKQAYPNRGLTLICRAEFRAIVDGFPTEPDEVVGLPFQPYACARPTEEMLAALEPVRSRSSIAKPFVLIDAGLRSSWLTEFFFSELHPVAAIRCGLKGTGPSLRGGSFRDLELPADAHERDRYRLLAEALDAPRVRALPWRSEGYSHEAWSRLAMVWLRERKLERGRYLVCVPLGSTGTAVKRWPMQSFKDVLHRFCRESKWPVVLLGDEREFAALSEMGSSLRDVPHALFAGRPEELSLSAGILAMAGAYLSNDTGSMHLAQAFEVPGVAIFGGGYGRSAYAPWARGSVGFFHPLPCFGCGWDCFLGHGLCVESIPAGRVYEALCEVSGSPKEAPRSVLLKTLSEPMISVVGDANERYRLARKESAERLDVIEELDRARRGWVSREHDLLANLAEEKARTDETERVAGARLTELEMVHAEAARRLDVIEELDGARREWVSREHDLVSRLAEEKARAQEMERVAGERLKELETVHAEAARRLDSIKEISGEAEVRRQKLEQVTGALKRSEAARLQLAQSVATESVSSADECH